MLRDFLNRVPIVPLLQQYASNIGSAIKDSTNIECVVSETYSEILRGIRMHFSTFIKALAVSDVVLFSRLR